MNRSVVVVLCIATSIIVLICLGFGLSTHFLVQELREDAVQKPVQYLHLERGGSSCSQNQVDQNSPIACWKVTRSNTELAILHSATSVEFLKTGLFDLLVQVNFVGTSGSFGLGIVVNNHNCTYSNTNGQIVTNGVPLTISQTCFAACRNIEITKGQTAVVNALFKSHIHQEAIRNTWDIEVKQLY